MSTTPAERLLVDLEAALVGDLAPFARGLLSTAPDAVLTADQLLEPQQISEIMDWLSSRLGVRPDRRAALSIWAGWHFRSVLPPLMAANVLFDVTPMLGLDQIQFVISVDLRAERIVIPARLEELSHDQGPGRFAALVHSFLAPLIRILAERSRITERVLWSNAGHVFEGFLRMLEPVAQGRPGLLAAKQLLAASHWPDGDRNRLFEPVRYIEDQRIRRVCCMRYLFPDGKTCKPCPLNLQARKTLVAHA